MSQTVYFDIQNNYSSWLSQVVFMVIALISTIGLFRSKSNNSRAIGAAAAILSILLLLITFNNMIPEYICYANAYHDGRYKIVEGIIVELPVEDDDLQTPFLIGDVSFRVALSKKATAGFNRPELLRSLSQTNKRVKIYYTSDCPYPGTNAILHIESVH